MFSAQNGHSNAGQRLADASHLIVLDGRGDEEQHCQYFVGLLLAGVEIRQCRSGVGPLSNRFNLNESCIRRLPPDTTRFPRRPVLTHILFLSTREAAVRLSIGANTLKKLRVVGGGPAFHRIGRRVVYSTEILDEWAKRATFGSTSEYHRASRHADCNRTQNLNRSGDRSDADQLVRSKAELHRPT